jgi:ribosomal protein L24E
MNPNPRLAYFITCSFVCFFTFLMWGLYCIIAEATGCQAGLCSPGQCESSRYGDLTCNFCTQSLECGQGQCFSSLSSAFCACLPGYLGSGCTESICDDMDCVYGECVVTNDGKAVCKCSDGYEGALCDSMHINPTLKVAGIVAGSVAGTILVGVFCVLGRKKLKRAARATLNAGEKAMTDKEGRNRVSVIRAKAESKKLEDDDNIIQYDEAM